MLQVPLKHVKLIQVGLEWREAKKVFQAGFRKSTKAELGRFRNSGCLEKKIASF